MTTLTKGTATITVGNLYVDVPHGLGVAPNVSDISVTPLSDLGGSSFSVPLANIDATNFRVLISGIQFADVSFSYQIFYDAAISTSVGYCSAYEVRTIAQVNCEQVGFSNNSDFENFIASYLIPQADKRIDTYCNHTFGSIAFGTWSLDGNGHGFLFMPTEKSPLIGLTSGTMNGVALPMSQLKIHDQYVDYDGGVFVKGKLNITLSGSYGYTDVPDDVESVAAQCCANMLVDMVRRKVLPDLFIRREMQTLHASALDLTDELKQQLDKYVMKQVGIG